MPDWKYIAWDDEKKKTVIIASDGSEWGWLEFDEQNNRVLIYEN